MGSYYNTYNPGTTEDTIAADSGVIREVAESVRSVRTSIDSNDSEFITAKNTLEEAFIGPGAEILLECLNKIKTYNGTVSDGLLTLSQSLDSYADTVERTSQDILRETRGH